MAAKDFVEFFYSNEEPSAELFRACLVKLAGQRGFTAAIETETNEGAWIIFRGKELAALINGCYKVVQPSYTGSPRLFSSWHLFTDEGLKEELSLDLIARLLGQHGVPRWLALFARSQESRIAALDAEYPELNEKPDGR